MMDDCLCELWSAACSSNISCSNLSFLQNFVDCRWDLIGKPWESQISQHHHRADKNWCRVSLVFPGKGKSSVWHSLWEKSIVLTNACTGSHADTASDACCDVGNNASVKIGSNHHIELGRVFDQLHRAVIHNHLFVLDEWEFFGSVTRTLQEKTIDQLHDVGLVNNSHFLSAGKMGELKGVLEQTVRVGTSCHLQRLHNSRINLMFYSWKFTFDVLPDDSDVNIVVTIINRRERVAKVDICIEIQMFVELVVVVVFGIDSFFGDHHTKKDALVLLQQFSLLAILKGEILDNVEFHGSIGSLEDIQNTLCITICLLVISGPIPMPEMRVTRCTSPKLGLWSSALYQVALWPKWKRLPLVNNLISTLALSNITSQKLTEPV